jgi:hypothetical protein
MPNTPEARVNVTVRLSPDELASIDKHAEAQDRSRSQVIRQMIGFASFAANPTHEPIDVLVPLNALLDARGARVSQRPDDDEARQEATRAAHRNAQGSGRVVRGKVEYVGTVSLSETQQKFGIFDPGIELLRYRAITVAGNVFPTQHVKD